jgi:hypothetical protein
MQCCSAYSSWRRLMHLLRRGAPPALPLARRRRRALPATRPVPLWCDAAAGSVREPLKSGLLAGQRASALCTCTLVPDFPVCSIMRLLHACWAARTITSLVAAGSSRSSLLTATRGSEGPIPVARLQECGIMMTPRPGYHSVERQLSLYCQGVTGSSLGTSSFQSSGGKMVPGVWHGRQPIATHWERGPPHGS